MTENEKQLVRRLIGTPHRGGPDISKEEFSRLYPSAVERGMLSTRLLAESIQSQSADELLCALVVGFSFAFAPDQNPLLCPLIDVDWHRSHEDVVSAIQEMAINDQQTIETFFRATQRVPKYLDFDRARALAVKAIWALGGIPGPESEAKLQQLAASSENKIIRRNAKEQLQLRKG